MAAVGDGRPYVTALISPEPDAAAALTGDPDPARNAGHPALVKALTEAVSRANEALNDAERVRRFVIMRETWTPAGGELTATMKLRRGPIATKHAAAIEALYGPPSAGVIDVARRD